MEGSTFEEFYETEYRAVLALARVLTGDRHQAEDLTHDAFAAALVSWDTLTNPEGWIRTVAANKARSVWRRRGAERRALGRLEGEVRLGSDLPGDTADFWEQVRLLPRRQSQAIALFYLEDRSVAEVAQILGCSESTARVHLTRGRKALASRLGVTE